MKEPAISRIEVPNAQMLSLVTELLREGKTAVIMTKGSSMLPFIRGGMDSVELEAREKYETGDIVLALTSPGHYVLHRLVVVEGDSVTLHGDGNLFGTEHCRLQDICGIAVRIIRKNGSVQECSDPAFRRRSARWAKQPYIVRRFVLAIYRRLI